ncbi:YceI family protein [Pseudoduganella flava]|uniref:YceI family protein n=1 Tax=Pseudoduganella flava TaxID=871742 RepID=UPI001E43C633|nr:YceI family protein [Pseudoduganella flava]
MRPFAGRLLAAAIAVLLAACAVPSPPPPPAPPTAPAAAPAEPYAGLLEGRYPGPLLKIGDDALIAITVRRGGPLARLGHDHVVAARRITGYAAPAAGLAALRFQLAEMTVDEGPLREEAGLTTQPSPDAIAGTRHNMLTKVLDAERWPAVDVRARRLPGAAGAMEADITLHGVTRRVVVPTTLENTAQGVVARGTLTILQTDFGIVPFAVLGGAMAVQDALEIRFAIPARATMAP